MKHIKRTVLRFAAVGSVVSCLVFGVDGASVGADPDTNRALVIECRGTVRPRQELTLRLRPSERLIAVRVAAGDELRAGDRLAEVFDGEAWTRLLDLKRARLESLLSRAELESKADRLAQLGDELKAQLALWKEVDPDSAERRVVALREKRDELQEQVTLLRLRVASPACVVDNEGSLPVALAAQIQKLEAQLASPFVLAPCDGRVAYLAPNPIRLGAGEIILEFWDTNVLVRAEVLQHQLAHVSPGCRAEVAMDFSEERALGAIVNAVETRAETQPGEVYPTFGVQLTLDPADHRLRPGMRVSVRVHTDGTRVSRGRP